MLDDECYPDSANRSYYAIFHAINALNALEGVGYKKHSAVMSHFNQVYIKTEIFDKEYGKIANTAFDLRKDNDYADFYIVSKKEVIEQHENAVEFVNRIEKHIKEVIESALE